MRCALLCFTRQLPRWHSPQRPRCPLPAGCCCYTLPPGGSVTRGGSTYESDGGLVMSVMRSSRPPGLLRMVRTAEQGAGGCWAGAQDRLWPGLAWFGVHACMLVQVDDPCRGSVVQVRVCMQRWWPVWQRMGAALPVVVHGSGLPAVQGSMRCCVVQGQEDRGWDGAAPGIGPWGVMVGGCRGGTHVGGSRQWSITAMSARRLTCGHGRCVLRAGLWCRRHHGQAWAHLVMLLHWPAALHMRHS